jgi:hypothetical protein
MLRVAGEIKYAVPREFLAAYSVQKIIEEWEPELKGRWSDLSKRYQDHHRIRCESVNVLSETFIDP